MSLKPPDSSVLSASCVNADNAGDDGSLPPPPKKMVFFMHPLSFLYFLLLLLRNVFQIEGCGERGRKRRGLHDTSVDFGSLFPVTFL